MNNGSAPAFLRRLSSFFVKLLYPPKCMLCRAVLPLHSQAPYLCRNCLPQASPLPLRTCPVCGKILDISPAKPYCVYCAGERLPFHALAAPFAYEGKIKEAVLRMKFHHCPNYADTFADFMYRRLQAYALPPGCAASPVEKKAAWPVFDAVVPAPISRERLAQRGYNQSALLAQRLANYLSVPYDPFLIKTKDTPPQSSLNARQRRANLAGAIACQKRVTYQNVLLVDDVYTTGATLAACAVQLKAAGAKHVYAAVAAVAVPPNPKTGAPNSFRGDTAAPMGIQRD